MPPGSGDAPASPSLNEPPSGGSSTLSRRAPALVAWFLRSTLDACAAELETSACDGQLKACIDFFTPFGEIGDGCLTSGSECAGGSCVAEPGQTLCGTCADFLSGPGIGESCDGAPCAEGDAHYVAGVCTCAEPRDVGEVCNDPILDEQWTCLASTCDPVTNECVPYGDVGDDCSVTPCDPTLHCPFELANPTCVVPVIGTVAGDPCSATLYGACGTYFDNGLACVDDDADGVGTCTAATVVELGEACDHENDSDNTALLWCAGAFTTTFCEIAEGNDVGVCAERLPLGGACYSNFVFRPCEAPLGCSLNPITYVGTCVERAQDGETCSTTAGCAETFSFCVDQGAFTGVCEPYFDFADPAACWE